MFDKIEKHFINDLNELIEDVSYAVGLYDNIPHYLDRYQSWKVKLYEDQKYNYDILSIDSPSIVCRVCWPRRIVQIGKFRDLNWKNNSCRIYPSNGRIRTGIFYCPHKHRIGEMRADSQDVAVIDRSQVSVYCPL